MSEVFRSANVAILLLVVLLMPVDLYGQGLAVPLTTQGLDQRLIPGARARGMGGCVIAAGTGTMSLFGNPAGLAMLSSPEARLGLGLRYASRRQMQEWRPDPYFAALSLLLENNFFGMNYSGQQKPYDGLSANWDQATRDFFPGLIAAALPLEVAGVNFSLGAGSAETINLDGFFQNNNVLSPYIGTYRPAPVPRINGDTLRADWYQYIRSRSGAINGITSAVAAQVLDGIQVGIAGTYYTGSSSDREERHDRGELFSRTQQYFRMDSVYFHQFSSGTSHYYGFNGTLGLMAGNPSVRLGLVVQTPLTIRRNWDRTIGVDSTGTYAYTSLTGSDRMILPFNYSLGLAVFPSRLWTIALDYLVNRYDRASFETDTTLSERIWRGGQVLRVGVEFLATDWLAVRGGYREDVQVFTQEGDALKDEPARGSVYAGGIGLEFGSIRIDVSYEYMRLKFIDAWMSNTNYNHQWVHSISIETGVQF